MPRGQMSWMLTGLFYLLLSRLSSAFVTLRQRHGNTINSGCQPLYAKPKKVVAATLETALGIVPPDEVWDTIQRARYSAQDSSYDSWPPCLRLFHPLARNPELLEELALDVAACIDALEIPAFQLRLSEWSIIPHAEKMELQWWASDTEADKNNESSSAQVDEARMTVRQREEIRQRNEAAELIKREEKKGYEAMLRRRTRNGQEVLPKPPSMVQDEKSSSRNNISSQKEYHEFDGPCVICLEPDETSRLALQELRSVLRHEGRLAKFSPFASTATADPSLPSGRHLWGDFRPLIPIASFDTVTQAIPVAKKLRESWKPITWDVTDLHFLTSHRYENRREQREGTTVNMGDMASTNELYDNSRSPVHLSVTQQLSSQRSNDNVMGCSALIMLHGEEMELDHELNSEVANLVAEKGVDGGFVRNNNVESNNLEEIPLSEEPSPETSSATSWSADVANLNLDQHGDIQDIEAYLADDGEYGDNDAEDSGTVVVIGRVHYFSGNAREYDGMPAPSVEGISSLGSGSVNRTSRSTSKSAPKSRLLEENKIPPPDQ